LANSRPIPRFDPVMRTVAVSAATLENIARKAVVKIGKRMPNTPARLD
jgi:hypothetical protein